MMAWRRPDMLCSDHGIGAWRKLQGFYGFPKTETGRLPRSCKLFFFLHDMLTFPSCVEID